MTKEDKFHTLLPLSRVPHAPEAASESSGVRSRFLVRAVSQINQLLPSIIESVPTPVLVVDEDLRVVVGNPAARLLLGASQSSIFGYSVLRFLSKQCLEEARIALLSQSGPYTYRDRVRAENVDRELDVVVEALTCEEGAFLCLSLIDKTDTDRERAEWTHASSAGPVQVHLEHAHHLEALGRLTSTFAHDFNNLLAVILGSLEAAERRLKKEEDVVEDVRRALAATERSIQATSQILHYAKHRVTAAEALNPAEVLLELRGLIERAAGDDIELIISTEPTRRIVTNAAQLETALLNLVINARDAIRSRGRIELSLFPVDVDEARAMAFNIPAGPYVTISVTDTGSGMSEEVKSRAFEPFFTTKSEGSGTGLGLSSVSSIMRGLGGTAVLSSEPGQGTKVELLFPSEAEAEPA